MNILILGGGGMLGHKVWQLARGRFRIMATVRGNAAWMERYGFPREEVIPGVEAGDFDSIVRAIDKAKPDAVINCIGIIKQLAAAKDPIPSISINSLFPHRVHALSRAAGARFVHISTDCVFSGRKGNYVESDQSDAEDLYGRSKFLGEVSGEGGITLRTSIIGRELSGASGLVEWFLANRGGKVNGFTRAIFSGLTTIALSRVILDVIEHHRDLSGLVHVSVDPINKFDLLQLLNESYGTRTEIKADDSFVIDRSLDSSRFRAATSFAPPSWRELVAEMAADPTPYDQWRKS